MSSRLTEKMQRGYKDKRIKGDAMINTNSAYRLSKDTTARYSSFTELAAAFGCREKKKDKDKLEAQKKKFIERNICKVCKQPLTFISGTNVMACTNPECKGEKHTSKDEDGNEKVWYTPISKLLDERNTLIAGNVFECNV